MLGHDRKQLHTWDDIKPYIRPEMFTEMLAINLDGCRGGQMATRWAESHRATKGANLDALLANGTFPIQVMTKWLLALRLVNRGHSQPVAWYCRGLMTNAHATHEGPPLATLSVSKRTISWVLFILVS